MMEYQMEYVVPQLQVVMNMAMMALKYMGAMMNIILSIVNGMTDIVVMIMTVISI